MRANARNQVSKHTQTHTTVTSFRISLVFTGCVESNTNMIGQRRRKNSVSQTKGPLLFCLPDSQCDIPHTQTTQTHPGTITRAS